MDKICTYSELDSFTGSISHNISDLPRLVNELKLACLLYDCVVLHANNIMEHPLTLPACEILYPFVKSGQLWTTTDYREKTPLNFIEKRAELFLGDILKKQSLRGLSKIRKQEFFHIIERWKKIIPQEFLLRRNVNIQVKTALTHLNDKLFINLKSSKIKKAHSMIDFVDKMKANERFDRESLFAWLGSLKGLILPHHLSKIGITIQKSFLVEGAKQHGSNGAKVWYGQFTRKLQKSRLIIESDFDEFTLSSVEEKLRKIGLDLNWLLSLPVENLFEIANSNEWKNFRNLIMTESFEINNHQEILSYLKTVSSPTKKLELLLTKVKISPLILPSSWLLSSQALLGKLDDSEKNFEKGFILNISTYTIYKANCPEDKIDLKLTELHLLTLLTNAGEIGLYEEHIKQLDIELERLEHLNDARLTHVFVSEDKIENRLSKLAILKKRLNDKLLKIDLMICVKKMEGNWYLGNKNGHPQNVKLESTIWDFNNKTLSKFYIPNYLSEQQISVWRCLWEYAPNFVNWQKISTVLTNDENNDSEKMMKRVSDVINKLQSSIKDTNYLILRDFCGNYRVSSKNSI